MKLVRLCFTALHSLVFGKVRELVGEIKYAFANRNMFYKFIIITMHAVAKYMHHRLTGCLFLFYQSSILRKLLMQDTIFSLPFLPEL